MIINRLDLLAFGQFTDVSLDLSAGPHRFHLVYGANESGKSTCMRAITSLLFGIATRTTDNYLHANPKMRVGAKLSGRDGESLTVIRRKTGKSKLNAEDDKTPIDEASLSQLLGGIDQDTFHQRFGMSHDELVAGGKAILESKGELGTILFAAGAGISQLKSIQSQLETDQKELFLANARKPIIQTLLKELDEKRKELRQLQTLPAEYKQLCDQLSESQRRAEQLSNEVQTCERQQKQLASYRSMLAVVPQWRAANERLSELENAPLLDEDFSGRRREATITIQLAAEEVESLDQALREIEKQLEETSADFQILDHEDGVVSLFQSIGARQDAAAEKSAVRDRINELNRSLVGHLKELEIPLGPDADQAAIDNAIAQVHVNESSHIQIKELAGKYELIRGNENDEKQRFDILRKQLSDLNDELEKTPGVEDPSVIESVIAEIGSPETLISAVGQRQIECDDLRAECVRICAELSIGQLEIEHAARLQVPSLGQIDEHDTSMTEAQQRHASVESQLDSLRERRKTANESLRKLRSDLELPTEDHLRESRQTRDSTVQQLQASDQETAEIQRRLEKLQTQIDGSDQVVDTMRSHHQQVAERTSAQKEIESLDLEIVRVENQLVSAKSLVDQAASAWSQLCASLWKQMGVKTATVRSMRSWVTKHQSLVDKHESLIQSVSRHTVAQEAVDRSKNRLATTLKKSLASRPVKLTAANSDLAASVLAPSELETENLESFELDTLYDSAQRLRSELVTSSRHAAQLAQKHADVSTELLHAESSHESSVRRRVQWDQEWQQATEKLAGEQLLSPSVIDARLERLSTIQNDQRERDTRLRELQAIELADQSFATRATETARLLRIEVAETTKPADLANRLHGLLQESKANFSEREKLTKELSSRREKLATTKETLDRATAQLTELCNEAGVDDPSMLPSLEQHAREKAKLIEERDSTAKQLTLVASGTSLSEFAEQVERQTPDELDQQISALETSLQDLQPRHKESLQKVGAIKQELAKIDGGDRAAELNQDIQFLTAKIQRHAQEYAKLKIASMILQRSIDHYRTENESPVLKIACEAFRELTCKKYSGLKAEYDESGNSKLFGVIASADAKDADEILVPVETMSLGTADALYLSMRLASLEHQLSGGQAAPVVIDDCLIQLDDDRTAAALQRFSNLSLKTQVILFTHHEHLIDLASKTLGKDGCHIHRLST